MNYEFSEILFVGKFCGIGNVRSPPARCAPGELRCTASPRQRVCLNWKAECEGRWVECEQEPRGRGMVNRPPPGDFHPPPRRVVRGSRLREIFMI